MHLLALSGARVRGSLPEATPDLVRTVLLEALPQFLSVAPGDEGAALGVLKVLTDRTRADGRLNAKRHARLRDAIDGCAEEHLRVMRDPRELTLSRYWGGLLRARGVDVRDVAAVRDVLEALARLPYAERAGLLTLPYAGQAVTGTDETAGADDDPDEYRAGGAYGAAWALQPYRRGLAMERQAAAGMVLGQRLALCLMNEEDEAPWVADLLGEQRLARLMDADGPEEWVEAVTKAGLSVARRWSYASESLSVEVFPAPGPGPRDMALVTAVGRVAEQYDVLWGEEPFAPPHPLPADRDGFVSGLRANGLLAPAVRLATAPPADPEIDPDGVSFAVATGFLVLDEDGTPCPGPSLEAWRERDAGELAGLAVRALVEWCDRLGADPDIGEEFDDEILGDLVTLYTAAGETRSVARDAAVSAEWAVPPGASFAAPARERDDAAGPREPGREAGRAEPEEPNGSASAYRLPSPPELERLLGLGTLDENDVAELEPEAHRLAARLDALARAGVVWRSGDAYGLTPLAAAVLREALLLAHGGGWPPRAAGPEADGGRNDAGDGEPRPRWTPSTVAERFPTLEAVSALDAERLVAAAWHWEPATARRVLRTWVAAGNGPDARWPQLLAALAAPAPRTHLADHRGLAARTLPDAPVGLVAGYVGDPVLGAWAAEALRAAGQPVEANSVPRSSRLLWQLDRLHALAVPAWRASFTRYAETADADGPEPTDGPDGSKDPGQAPELQALYDAFQQTAADWPGGADALTAELAHADPFTASHSLELLTDHPDQEIARPAALAHRECERARSGPVPEASGGGAGRRKAGKKTRKRGGRR